MSSTMRGRSGPSRYGKRAASGPRDRRPPRMRRESSSATRMDGNGAASPPLQPQNDQIHVEEPPQWFLVYMENFKKQLMAEFLTSLDTDLENEEKRRRYKRSYFMLKGRLHHLEKQLEDQNYSNGPQQQFQQPQQPQQPQLNGSSSRSQQNDKSHGSHRKIPQSFNQNFSSTRNNQSSSAALSPSSASTSPNTEDVPPQMGEARDVVPPLPPLMKPKEERRSRKGGSERKEKSPKPSSDDSTKQEVPQGVLHKAPQEVPQGVLHKAPQEVPEKVPQKFSHEVPHKVPQELSPKVPKKSPLKVPQEVPSEKSDEEKPQELSKKIRSILNKLTPSNFQNLLDQIKNLNVENEADEQEFINQFFEKAIDEPMYSTTYALMCKQFVLLQPSILRLRRIIISRCESEFLKHVELDNLKAKKLAELDSTDDDLEKQKISDELREMKEKNPKEFMGDILFIGELYNQDLLCNKFLHKIIQHLLQSPDETDVEYLCKLLKNCGKNFELRGEDPTAYYENLMNIAERGGLSSRIKFMIKDLIEIKLDFWEIKRDNSVDDDVVENYFSFSMSLDDCAKKGGDDFMEDFYKVIQPQFNFFESTNFTRELLNSAIERGATRDRYFDVFKRGDGNKIIEWVGGDEVFLGIIVRELGLFFDDAEDLFANVPEVWLCLRDFLIKIVDDWEKEFDGKKMINLLETIKDVERRRKFSNEVFDKLQEILGEERIKKWLPEGIPLFDEDKN